MTNDILTAYPTHTVESHRTLDYPIGEVYAAWTIPQYLAKWWGPEGFTNTFREFDFRVGGRWDFVMHGPDGKNYDNLSIFLLIEPEKQIIFNHVVAPEFQMQVHFKELEGNKTHVNFNMVFETEEACNKIRNFVEGKNEENFDRLEKVLS